MKLSKKTVLVFVSICLLLTAYPAFVLCYTWTHVWQSDLKGGRHGPLDAYRHTLASAVVAYTLNENAVNFVTLLMESSGLDENAMDAHNNSIGAQIGAQAESFSAIEPMVLEKVENGQINATSPNQITWLPKSRWKEGRAW